MTRRVFLDTGAVYSLADRADTDHPKMRRAWEDSGLIFITNDLILVEAASLITKRLSKQAAVRIIGGIRSSRRIQIIPSHGRSSGARLEPLREVRRQGMGLG